MHSSSRNGAPQPSLRAYGQPRQPPVAASFATSIARAIATSCSAPPKRTRCTRRTSRALTGSTPPGQDVTPEARLASAPRAERPEHGPLDGAQSPGRRVKILRIRALWQATWAGTWAELRERGVMDGVSWPGRHGNDRWVARRPMRHALRIKTAPASPSSRADRHVIIARRKRSSPRHSFTTPPQPCRR